MPVVHRGVEVQAGIGRRPGGVADLLPEVAGLESLGDLLGGAADQIPVAVGFHRAQEVVLQRHRIVGVLAGDGEVGFRIPVGVVDVERDLLVALPGELDHALDVVVGHQAAARELDLAAEGRVLLGIEAVVAAAFAVHAGLHHGLEVLLVDLGAGDQRRDLLLLLHLPVDIGLDVGMVGIDHDHLGRTTRGAARLDRTGGAVADLEEAHQARRAAAAGQLFAFAAQAGEVRAGAGAVFEQARLAHPEVHDAALVDEVVADALDEAGMRLRMLIGRLRFRQLAGLPVDIVVALAGAIDAVGPMQAGVEPLRRVRRDHLLGELPAQFVEERQRVFLRREVAALPAPIGPAAGEAIEYLLGRGLADDALVLGQRRQGVSVGYRTPQPRRHGLFLDLLQARGDAGLAEILLRQHVGGDLRPELRNLDVLGTEHDRAVRVADLRGGQAEIDPGIGRLSAGGVASFNSHGRAPSLLLPGPTFLAGAGMLSVRGHQERASTPPVVRSSAGGSGLFSLHRAAPVRPGPAAARSLAGYPTGSGPPGHAFNAPKRFTRHVTRTLLCGPVAASVSGSLAARSVVSNTAQNQGRTALHPRPEGPGGVVILEPLWERPAGPKHTRAEQVGS